MRGRSSRNVRRHGALRAARRRRCPPRARPGGRGPDHRPVPGPRYPTVDHGAFAVLPRGRRRLPRAPGRTRVARRQPHLGAAAGRPAPGDDRAAQGRGQRRDRVLAGTGGAGPGPHAPGHRTRARRGIRTTGSGAPDVARRRRQLAVLAHGVAPRLSQGGPGARPGRQQRAAGGPVDRHAPAQRSAPTGSALGRPDAGGCLCGADRRRAARRSRARVPPALRGTHRRRRTLGGPQPRSPADGAHRGGVRRTRRGRARRCCHCDRAGGLPQCRGRRRRTPGHRGGGRRPRRSCVRPVRHGSGVRDPAARSARGGARREPVQTRSRWPAATAGRQGPQGTGLPAARRRRRPRIGRARRRGRMAP